MEATKSTNMEETSNVLDGIPSAEDNMSDYLGTKPNEKDDNSTIFDYFSEIYDFTRRATTTDTFKRTNTCKDSLAVDEFVELLKKKLATDPMFKDVLSTKNPLQNGNIDSSYTDPSVAAFVSRIYSKKEPTITTKLPEQDYVNSTLLVDLVEAVIFRSAGKNLIIYEYTYILINDISQINKLYLQIKK